MINHLHSKSPTFVDECGYSYPITSSSHLRTPFTNALEERLNGVSSGGSYGPGSFFHILGATQITRHRVKTCNGRPQSNCIQYKNDSHLRSEKFTYRSQKRLCDKSSSRIQLHNVRVRYSLPLCYIMLMFQH